MESSEAPLSFVMYFLSPDTLPHQSVGETVHKRKERLWYQFATTEPSTIMKQVV